MGAALMPAAAGAETPAAPPIRTSTKLFYGMGSIAFGVKDNGFSLFLLLFYNQVVGLPAQWVGLALMVSLLFDGIADPLIGHASDNLRSRWGRRHPFMYAAAIPVAIAYFLLWNPPLSWSQPALMAWLVVVTIAVRFVIAAYEVPSAALAPELTEDYDQRTGLIGYRALMGWCGGIGSAVAAYAIFLRPDAEHAVGQLNPTGYAHMGAAGALVMTAAILISAIGTHARIPHLKPAPPRRRMTRAAALAEVGASLANGSLLALLASGVFSALSMGIGNALNIYMLTYFWRLDAGEIAGIMTMLFVGAGAAFVVAPRVSRRFGKRACAIAAGVGFILAHLSPVALRLADLFPREGSPLVVPILTVTNCLTTMMIVSSTMLVASMLADVVEDNEVRTGRRSEGLVFSANLFIQKCVSGVGVFGSGLVLAAVAFPEGAAPAAVPDVVLRDLAIVFVAVQAGFYLVAMALIGRYRITRASHAANLALLAAREAAQGQGLNTPPSSGRR